MGKTNKKEKQQVQAVAPDAVQNTKQQASSNPRPRKFEIQVFDVEEIIDETTGNVVYKRLKPAAVDPLHPVTTIEASTKEELDLIALTFAMCGLQIKIIREVTLPNNLQIASQIPSHIQQTAALQSTVVQNLNAALQQVLHKAAFSKPKMFSSGGIDFKFDGLTMYLKQWIKLSPAEAASIRVISDSTNKIVSMKGKHFEALKWIAIEETDDSCKENDVIE